MKRCFLMVSVAKWRDMMILTNKPEHQNQTIEHE